MNNYSNKIHYTFSFFTLNKLKIDLINLSNNIKFV